MHRDSFLAPTVRLVDTAISRTKYSCTTMLMNCVWAILFALCWLCAGYNFACHTFVW